MRRKREEKSWTKAISGDRGWHGLVREQARAREEGGGEGRAGEQGNEMIAVYAGSFRLRLTRS